MKKPQSKTIITTYYDYHECAEWIEQKLGYPLRDTLHSYAHYEQWCEQVGEAYDPSSNEQYSRYLKHPDGQAKCPEYRDYWHFLVEYRDIFNGVFINIDNELSEVYLDTPEEAWTQEITQAFIDEFGEDAEYWVGW